MIIHCLFDGLENIVYSSVSIGESYVEGSAALESKRLPK